MTRKNKTYGFATRAIHSGAYPEIVTGAIIRIEKGFVNPPVKYKKKAS